MPAVEVDSLTISYGKVTAVDGLSFTAKAGEVTCLLGPNGAGKTSTVEALEGLRRPTSGRLSVIGLDPLTDHGALTPRIGVMLQEGGIHPAVRVREAMRHAAALYPDPVDVRALLERLGLAGLERRTYRQLSGGEQRRLALALALVGRPQVAFLDEPTSGVDPAGRQVIRQVVADLRNDGVTVLLTTHDLDETERIADRVVIILDGRLVASGTVDDLTRSSGGDEQIRFRAPAGLDRASLADHLDGADVVEIAPGDYAVALPPSPRTVAAITAWLAEHDLPLADLRAGRQRLEDVYLRLTAGGAPAPAGSAASAPESGPGTGSTTGPDSVEGAGRDATPSRTTDADDDDDTTDTDTDTDTDTTSGPGWPQNDTDTIDTDPADETTSGPGWPWDDDTTDTDPANETTPGPRGPRDDDETRLASPDRLERLGPGDVTGTDDTVPAPSTSPGSDERGDRSDLAADEPAGPDRRPVASSVDEAHGSADIHDTHDDDDDALNEVDEARATPAERTRADAPTTGKRRRLRRSRRRAGAGDGSDSPAPAGRPGDPDTSSPSTFDEFWRSVERGSDSGHETDWSDWKDEGDRRGGKRR